MSYENDGYAHLKAAEKEIARTRQPSVEQLTQLAVANFLGGILQELRGARNNIGDIASMLNTTNGWLLGNVEGRPEVIVHRAEDIIYTPVDDTEDEEGWV